MAATQREPEYIPLQVGSELRIARDGGVILDNPTIESGPNEVAADAVITYYFDPQKHEHVIRLVDPLQYQTRARKNVLA